MHLSRRGVKTRPSDRTCRVLRRERFPPSSHPAGLSLPPRPAPEQLFPASSVSFLPATVARERSRFSEAREGAALSGRAGDRSSATGAQIPTKLARNGRNENQREEEEEEEEAARGRQEEE